MVGSGVGQYILKNHCHGYCVKTQIDYHGGHLAIATGIRSSEL